jgi:photosystem II stability/assembly factor-like uncharacterized protein
MRLPLTLLAALLAASFIASSCRDNLPPGPKQNSSLTDTIAWWPHPLIDGTDATGHGHDGTWPATAPKTVSQPNRFGKLLLTSHATMTVKDTSNLNFTRTDSYTITAWVFCTGTNDNFSIYKQTTSGSTVGYNLAVINGYPRALITLHQTDTLLIPGRDFIADSGWHLLALSVKGGVSATLYVDTLFEGTMWTDGMTPEYHNDGPLTVYGTIYDEILIYGRSLTATEITARFHEGGWYAHRTDTTSQPHDTTADWIKGSDLAITGANAMSWPYGAYGFAVGIYGQFCNTSDSGKTWTKQNTGIQDDLFGVDCAIDFTTWNAIGLAVGGGAIPGGVIIRTTDYGRTWMQPFRDSHLHPANSAVLRDVKFFYDDPYPSLSNAIAVGWDSSGHGIIEISNDSGQTWSTVQTTSQKLYSVAVSHWIRGYAVVVGDGGQVLITSDMGISWTTASTGTENLRGVSLDASALTMFNAVAISEGSMTYWSTDLGVRWHANPSAPASGLTAVCNVGGSQAWATFHFGGIIHTSNAGTTWTATNNVAGPTGTWNCMALRDPYHLAIAGENYSIYYLKLQ